MRWLTYNTEDKGKYLFKFISKENLIKFLETGNIWFSRSDKFGDKMECVSIDDLKTKRLNFNKIESRKRKHLISCFHEGTFETIAFWDTYAEVSEKRRVYALKFDRVGFEALVKNATLSIEFPLGVNRLIHGNVKYKNLLSNRPENLKKQMVTYPCFRKEYGFSYEREYRYVIQFKSDFEKEGFNFNIGNLNNIQFDILVNPLLKINEYNNNIIFIHKMGFREKFKHSSLTKWLKPEKWKR